MTQGVWTLYSDTDARWRASGISMMPMGMAPIPPEVHDAVSSLKEHYGEPPSDLKVNYLHC